MRRSATVRAPIWPGALGGAYPADEYRLGHRWRAVPRPPALDITRTDSARVIRLFEHVRSLSTYTSDGIFGCLGHGTTVTTIKFLDSTTVLLQMDFVAECGAFWIVGYVPHTYVRPDEMFSQELNDLIANPT